MVCPPHGNAVRIPTRNLFDRALRSVEEDSEGSGPTAADREFESLTAGC